jgi:hypothetical protein
VVAASTDTLRSAVSIHEMGKRVEGARFPIFGDFGPFLRRFGSLEARTLAPASATVIKMVMIQQLFKFSLS